MDLSDVVSVVGALGIGSFIGQYLIGSQQRRQVRSEVLRHLANVESARWAGESPHLPSFTESMRELETAGLIARVPRRAVAHYKLLAHCAKDLSDASWEEDPDPEYGGGIDAQFSGLVRAAAGEISRVVWSPWLGRLGMNRRLIRRRQEAATIERIRWALENLERFHADY